MEEPARTHQTRLALALGRMMTGSLSAIASSLLIYKILLRYRVQRRSSSSSVIANTSITTYHRILLGMSLADILYSLGSAAGPLAVTASAGGGTIIGWYGTTATCTAQGASCQLLGAVVLYTAALNTYFMLKIRYNVSDVVLSRRCEPWLHAIPVAFATATTTAGIALQIFNPMIDPDLGCWIASYPNGCFLQPETCTRGQRLNAGPFSWSWRVWILAYIWLLLAFVVVLFNSVLIYTAIRHQERRNERYTVLVAPATPIEPTHCFAPVARHGQNAAATSLGSESFDISPAKEC